MIDFELSPEIENMRKMVHAVADQTMRPISREFDEREHEEPTEWHKVMWEISRSSSVGFGGEKGNGKGKKEAAEKSAKPSERFLASNITIEELSWGDAGLYLSIPNAGLGGAAVSAAGTPEQRKRFLARFQEGEPKWAAMAITEPGAGSDSAAITTTAVRDGDCWVLNGTKIYVTSGHRALDNSEGFVVVWATVDRSAGRAGIKAFIVDHGTPGATVTKVEDKLGIRASDTAAIVFEDCRIPLDNLLGSPEVKTQSTEGFKGVMATFDATRPAVAASAIGIGRAAVDFVRDALEKAGVQIRYDTPPTKLTTVERDFMDMEANVRAARLLTWRASWMMDRGMKNSLEASMCKAKAGLAVTQVTQKAVEILGPLGYSRNLLLEKWMRDAKINDIFEGTQQINLMVVARRILDYSSKELN